MVVVGGSWVRFRVSGAGWGVRTGQHQQNNENKTDNKDNEHAFRQNN